MTKTISLDKLAYSLPNLSVAVDLSVEKIRDHIRRDLLVPTYVDSKPIVMQEEALRWLRSLPAERPGGVA